MGNCSSTGNASSHNITNSHDGRYINTATAQSSSSSSSSGSTASSGSSSSTSLLGYTSSSSPLLKLNFHHTGNVADVCSGFRPGQFFSAGAEDLKLVSHSLYTNPLHHSTAFSSTLQCWDTGHERSITRISAATIPNSSSSAGLIATASRDLTIRLWSQQLSDISGGNGSSNSSALDDNDSHLSSSLSSSSSSVVAKPVSLLRGHEFSVSAVSLTADAGKLASGGRDTTVRVWDVATSKQLYKAATSQNVVTCLKWYPSTATTPSPSSSSSSESSSSIFLQGGEDLKVRIWDTRAGLRAAQVLDGYVYFPLCLDISSDGNYVLTSSKGFNGVGCEVRLWDLRGGHGSGTITSASSSSPASESGGVDDSSRTSLSSSTPQFRPVQLHSCVGHVQDATACAFMTNHTSATSATTTTKDSLLFISASKDGSIRTWGRDTGSTCLSVYTHPTLAEGSSFTSLAVLNTNFSNNEGITVRRKNNSKAKSFIKSKSSSSSKKEAKKEEEEANENDDGHDLHDTTSRNNNNNTTALYIPSGPVIVASSTAPSATEEDGGNSNNGNSSRSSTLQIFEMSLQDNSLKLLGC